MLPNGPLYTVLVAFICLLTTGAARPNEENTAPQELPSIIPHQSVLPILTANVGPNAPPATTPPALASASSSSVPERGEVPEHRKNCFYAEAELCLQQALEDSQGAVAAHRDVNSCQCRAHPTVVNSWYCCNITHMSMISTCSNISAWINLHIRNASLQELDLSNSIYQTLHSLAITDGNITRVIKSFSRVSSIKCLNISSNNLSDISPRALSSVPNLKFLDISRNNLSRIPNWNQNQNISVDVSGNKRMLCQPLLDAIFRDSFKFVDPDSSFCLLNNTFNWFNSTDYLSIRQLEMASRFQSECPVITGFGNCTCMQDHMIIMGDQSKPYAKLFCRVDCSNLGLIEFPLKLPENTIALNISNNNITSIGKHFHSNPTYQSIRKLYADNNQILSIYELEGTEFMDHFQRLYLRNNALSRIPQYLLNNALDSEVGRNIYLGGNKLECDCNSAKVLKLWLLERNRDIPDYNDILCRNMPQRVMELQELKVCQSPHDWTDYIYYLIATEVLLLLALIAKVSYDYWVFKTAGYLPWPASKMPKLPCDWLCES